MDVEADRVNGQWKYKTIKIRTKKPAQSLNIIPENTAK
jgi:hypothetical protein